MKLRHLCSCYLRRLRDPVDSLVLWVEAICINQKDNNEKAHQVAMMREIYSSCQKMIIWLGEDLDTTEAGSKSIVASRACDMLGMLGAGRHLDHPCQGFPKVCECSMVETNLGHSGNGFTQETGIPLLL